MFALTNLDKIDGFKIMGNFIYFFKYCIEQNREDTCHNKDIFCCYKKLKDKGHHENYLDRKHKASIFFFQRFSAFESFESLLGRKVFLVKCHVLDL